MQTTKFKLNNPQDLKYEDRLTKINILSFESTADIFKSLLFKSKIKTITIDTNMFIYSYDPGFKSLTN